MRTLNPLGSVALTFALVGAGSALAQSGGVSTASRDVMNIPGYWTAERMAAAQPADPALPGAPAPGVQAPQPTGRPGATLAGGGGTWSLAYADDAALAELAAAASNAPTGYTYPPPENTWPIPVAWYGSFPLRTAGKMFFTQNGLNYVCSGSSIGGRAVLTAGHCVSDGSGNWSTNISFVPALRNAWRPYGTWTYFQSRTFTAWHTSGNWCRDVGAFGVNDLAGVKLSAKVGWLGFAWDWGANIAWTGLGYPSQSPWVGTIMVATNASYSSSDAPGGCSPATLGMGTRQTPGCSGGPWVWQYRAQIVSNNYANGVFSHYYTSQPLEFFTPYFDLSVHDTIYVFAMGW